MTSLERTARHYHKARKNSEIIDGLLREINITALNNMTTSQVEKMAQELEEVFNKYKKEIKG